MRSRSVAVAVVLALVCFGGSVACWFRSAAYRRDAEWHLLRGNAAAHEYAQTFDDAIAEQQLQAFELRREALEWAHVWQRGQMLLLLSAVASAVASYLLHLLARLRRDLSDTIDDPVVEAQLRAQR